MRTDDSVATRRGSSNESVSVGIARIMQCGWYKEVRVKDLDSHAVKALLVSRALLVKIKRDLENQIRGLLKNSLRPGAESPAAPE
jgi:transposase